MWLFTKYGFFSAVCARKDMGLSADPDPSKVMLRARIREHLEKLKRRFPDQLEPCSIQATKDTDYAYRLFVPKATFQELLSDLGKEMDYTNFKNECSGEGLDAGYLSALHEVWAVMHRLQKRTP